MPEDGSVDSVAIYNQGSVLTFELVQLRPSIEPGQYSVVYRSGTITPEGATDSDVDLELPNGTTEVLAGDIFAHYGRGIPFTDSPGDEIVQGGDGEQNFVPIYWQTPVTSIPEAGSPDLLTLSTSEGSSPLGNFPIRLDLVRSYSMAVNFLSGGSAFGDINGDGLIGLADAALMQGALGGVGDDATDLNSDGIIDRGDVVELLSVYGVSPSPSPAAVPEPSTFTLMCLVLVIHGVRRNRSRVTVAL